MDPNLLWAQTGDSIQIRKENIDARRALISDVFHAKATAKKRFVDLLQELAKVVKGACRDVEIGKRKLAESHSKVDEFSLKVQFVVPDS